jgi:Tfp pilus assembly protein PilO
MKELLKNKLMTAVVIVALGFLYGGYQIYDFSEVEGLSLSNSLEQSKRDLDSLKSELVKVKAFAGNIPAVKQAFREQSLQLEAVLDSIPRSLELSPLLRKLNLLAQNSGVEIGSFRPDKSESDSGFFKSIGLEINIRGGFLPTLVFFDQVSKMKRVMNFEEIKMRVMNQNKEEAVPVLETNVKLKAFRLGDA